MQSKNQKVDPKSKNRYSFAFKKDVIESVENGKMSQNQASLYYDVSRKSISQWLKKYGTFDKKLREMGGKSPRQEVADMRAKLQKSESENMVLKAVLGMVGDEFGEEVLKKYLPESLTKKLPRSTKK
jgi:transposase-like protein